MTGEDEKKKKGRLDEIDSFWDLGDMIPKRRAAGSRPFSGDTEAAPVVIGERPAERTEKIPPREGNGAGAAASANAPENAPASAAEKLKRAFAVLDAVNAANAEKKAERFAAVGVTVPGTSERSVSGRSLAPGREAPLSRVSGTEPEATLTVSASEETGKEQIPPRQVRDDRSEFTKKNEPLRPLYEYLPEGHPLLTKVSVYPWPSGSSYYLKFRAEAEKYLNGTPEPADYVPFFGYRPMPQTLDDAQRRYYLWFRELANRGEYGKADLSYILLYIYEILNEPDLIPPETGAARLSGLWAFYRGEFPSLDAYLTEWVTDYCLIHRVRPDIGVLAPFLDTITRRSSLREFWIGLMPETEDPLAGALYRYGSNYNWETSRFCTPETRPLFEKHILAAFCHAFSRPGRDGSGRLKLKAMFHSRILRDSYLGAPCVCEERRRIEVEYYSCTRSPELRFAVTDTVRYAENQLRALMGVKSRYRVTGLDPILKEGIDEYFAPLKKKRAEAEAEKRRAVKEPEVPSFNDALYEAADAGFSEEAARRIEENAWDTTERLVDAFEDDGEIYEETPEVPEEKKAEENALPDGSSVPDGFPAPVSVPLGGAVPLTGAGDGLLREGFRALLRGDRAGFEKLAAEANLLPDTLAEKLNAAAYDIVGDIAAEPDGEGGWRLIEDYEEDIAGWITQ